MSWQGMNNIDISLVPFLKAPEGNDAQRQLSQLIAEFTPSIKGIVRSKLRVSLDPRDGSVENQDALEIISDVQTLLFAELQRLKDGTCRKAIGDFHGYLAVVTYHACYQYLRQKHPERWRLKNRLRYLLTHRPTLALWKNDDGRLLCDLASPDQARMLRPPAVRQQNGGYYLVRPDMYIAYRSTKFNEQHLKAFLESINLKSTVSKTSGRDRSESSTRGEEQSSINRKRSIPEN